MKEHKLRILAVSDLYPPDVVGGAERSFHALLSGLHSMDASVDVVTTTADYSRHEGGSINVTRLRHTNASISPRNGKRSATQKAMWQLSRNIDPIRHAVVDRLRLGQYDAVLTSNISFFGAALWNEIAKIGIPIIHIVRDYYLTCAKGTRLRDVEPCKKQCTLCRFVTSSRRSATNNLSHVVYISEFVKILHQREVVELRGVPTSVIPVSVDVQPLPEIRVHKTSHATFGMIARLSEEKGVRQTIQAFQDGFSPHDRLLIAGNFSDSELEKYTREAANSDDRIELLGPSTPSAFFPLIDYHLAPSQWAEPLSRTPIEAAMFGIPSVVSNFGGQPEVIAALGFGRTCNATDVTSVRQAMTLLARDFLDPRQLQANAVRAYSTDIVAAQMMQILKGSIGKREFIA